MGKRTEQSTAVETLRRMGYEWKGGALWKPPLGEEPDWVVTLGVGGRPVWHEPKKEWNGEGLPTVGVECEVSRADDMENWFKFIPRAYYYAHYRGDSVVVGDFRDDNASWNVDQLHLEHYEFRPIETTEQKAQREREEAISEMKKDIHCLSEHNKFVATQLLGDMYDAGYRKQP